MEDNDATILIIKTGRNPALRHISRTHGVNVAWLHEIFQRPEYRLCYQPTLGQCSDIFTKPFTTAAAWRHACDLIGVLPGEVAGSGRGGGNALQTWADRVRAAQSPGLSKAGGEKKRTTCPLRASHDTLTTPSPTDSTRTTGAAVAAAAVGVKRSLGFTPCPALCAPAHPLALARLLPGPYQAAAMASSGAFSASGKGKSEGGKMPGGGKGAAPGSPYVAPKAGVPGGKGKGPANRWRKRPGVTAAAPTPERTSAAAVRNLAIAAMDPVGGPWYAAARRPTTHAVHP